MHIATSFFPNTSAETQKPKISASSFRDLTARLKRPVAAIALAELSVIPEIVKPTIIAPVNPAIAEQMIAAPVIPAFAEEMITAPVIPDFAEQMIVAPVIEVPLEIKDELFDPQPDLQRVQTNLVAFDLDIPLPEAAVKPVIEPVGVLLTEDSDLFLAPPIAQITPLKEILKDSPDIEAAFEPTLVGADIPLEIQVVSTDTDSDIQVKQELEKRRTELELETIWRMLLAKPTAEDLAQYLREVGEFAKQEGGMSIPVAADFDLATILPASEVHDTVTTPNIVDIAIEDLDEPKFAAGIKGHPAELFDAAASAGFENAELARSLLDMMATGASSGLPHERALAADTLLRLLPKLDLKPLVMLAERLAMMDNPPHLLVARLIRDPRVEVAGPLLENCMHITDRDLQMVTEEAELAKLRMIARRRKLSRAISDVLIKTSEPSVLLTLVRNMEAEISHEGFNALIANVDEQPDLLAPLATRPDFTAPFAFELFWHAPAPMRRYILSRFLTDSETLGKILKITLATKDVEEHEDQSSGDFAIMEALDRAARGKREEASEELAAAIKIAPDTALRVLNDPEGEPLVVMLKAAGYPRKAMRGLLKKMSESELPIISRLRDIEDLQSIFETMSFTKARILLTYWDWAQCKSGPYAPVH